MKKISVSVIIPCLNEGKAIGLCVKRAFIGLEKISKKQLEIIVIDNGSKDNSVKIAKKAGARVVFEEKRGYGFALRQGIIKAKGEIIVMGDSDGTYDFTEIPILLKKVISGYDLAIGSRLSGKIEKGAMPFLHRFLGTPLLNILFSIFFNVKLTDTQSGFRAFRKKTVGSLNFKTSGMEFASEMIYKSARRGYKIGEVPISYSPRMGISKLSPLRDAWRHIKFMLLFSPSYLFIYPGLVIFTLGFLMVIRLSLGQFNVFGRYLDIHSMLAFAFLTILGFQIIFLGLFAKTYAYLFLKEEDKLFLRLLKNFTLERGIAIGGIFAFFGILLFLYIFYVWFKGGFGALSEQRLLILSVTLAILGMQGIFSSFFFALLGSGEGNVEVRSKK